jgi:hypothetical protein
MAGDDQLRLEGGHLVQQLDPGSAVVGGGGVVDPDVLLLEEQDATEESAVLGLPQVVAVGQFRRAAPELEAVALQGEIAGQGGAVDQAGGQVRAERLPGFELGVVGVLDVLDDDGGAMNLASGKASARTSAPK